MKIFLNLSIKYKIAFSFLVVVVIFVLQGLNSKNSLTLVHDTFELVAQENQPAVEKALLLNAQIESVFASLGIYLLTNDSDQEKAFVTGLNELGQSITLLKKQQGLADTESQELIKVIDANIKILSELKVTLLKLSKDQTLNIKARGFAEEHINGKSRNIQQLLSQFIQAEDEEEYIEERKQILSIANKLRYTWANLMTEFRLFLAFKADSGLDNVTIYSNNADELVARLIELQDEDDLLTLDQSDALEQFVDLKQAFMISFAELVDIHKSPEWRQDSFIIKTVATPLLIDTQEKINSLIDLQKDNISLANKQVKTIYQEESQSFVVIIALALVIVIAIVWFLTKLITSAISHSLHIAENIAQGNLKNIIESSTTDETGQLLTALSRMQTSLNKNIETERETSRENARVKTALDNISGNVMVIGPSDSVVYANDGFKNLYSSILNLDVTIGLESTAFESDIYQANHPIVDKHAISCNNSILWVTSNKIQTADGEILGKVYEVEDKTFEISMESEVANVVSLAMRGDLSTKINLNDKTGFFATLSSNTNELMSIVENALNSLNDSMQTLAEGDLTHDVNQVNAGIFGEVEGAAAKTVTQLREITKKIIHSARIIDEISNEIAKGNGDLSERSEQQAAALEETAASIEELTSTVKDNSQNSHVANELARSAQNTALEGGNVISEAIQAMEQINESSSKISDIIGVIDEIAFQTNLLALNASVEAARAGEQGRGFAVVATEVRNLAQRSATAAKEIKELINDSVNKVKAGSDLVDASGQSLKAIESGVKKVVDIISEIASASVEQSAGIEEVNVAIAAMDTLTQQNAALAEEVTAASINLSERSSIMQQDVGFFKIDDSQVSKSSSYQANEVIVFDGSSNDKKVNPVKTLAIETVASFDSNLESDDWDEF
ncbi:MAG: HAMP domain-containing protein [Gammaproteobacteria bacterium]|nr:HAMP domain-containing protein [Gammaproteobacteria bacterium]